MASDGYSRFVAGAKIALPLSALTLLSTIFMFSGEVDPTQSIPYTELNVDALVREQRISNPYFSSVTEAGVTVLVTASSSRPDPENRDRYTAENIAATFKSPSGEVTRLIAPLADVDNAASQARMSGGIVITGADDMMVETDALTSDLASSEVISDGNIVGTSAFGDLEAGQLHILPADANGNQQWVFQDGVKLVYVEDTPQ